MLKQRIHLEYTSAAAFVRRRSETSTFNAHSAMSEAIFDDQGPEGIELSELGRYSRLQDARDRGLVVTSMDLPHWIVRHGKQYAVCVESANRERVSAALAEYESDERSRVEERVVEPLKISKFAVLMTLLVMAGLYSVQVACSEAFERDIARGIADDILIRSGEWWRCFTALTLHGDSEHLVSNLSLAVFAFAFVYARLGVGYGLLGTIVGGALGNALNSVAHLSEAHRSLGSSTALFAALGLLSGSEIAARLTHASRSRWPLIVPIGGALAFLGLFGGGGGIKPDGTPIPVGRVDLGAHLFGLLAGVIVGAVLYRFGARAQTGKRSQIVAGCVGVGMLVVAWYRAKNV
jgi:rhomboid protease GluP